MSWRNTRWMADVSPSCRDIHLDSGLLIFKDQGDFEVIERAIYRMKCYGDAVPMLSTNSGKLRSVMASNLPIVANSWATFTHTNSKGSFEYSVVPIIYSISASAVITWFLTVFVLTSYTVKPSLLLKSSTILSSIFLLIVIVRAIYDLHTQQLGGYLSGTLALHAINSKLYLSIIDLLAVILLQINQVQVIMRLFSRQSDKRLTLIVGLTASLSSQIIWAISQFYEFPIGSEAGDIIPTFIYLTRTSMAICYAALISVFLIMKLNLILANRRIWLLTLFTFIVIYGPVAFFVADVANAFVYELSEIFSVVTYVVCVVIPWEWCNKFNLIMRAKEKEGVLGRRFYEDELYELDGLDLFVEEEDADGAADGDGDGEDGDDGESNNDNEDDGEDRGSIDPSPTQGASSSRQRRKRYVNLKQRNPTKTQTKKPKPQKVLTTFDKTKQAFFDITDAIIATGFAIPRSASVPSTGSPYNNSSRDREHRGESIQLQNLRRPEAEENIGAEPGPVRQQPDPDQHTRNRRDIFVYSTKQVAIDFSDNEND